MTVGSHALVHAIPPGLGLITWTGWLLKFAGIRQPRVRRTQQCHEDSQHSRKWSGSAPRAKLVSLSRTVFARLAAAEPIESPCDRSFQVRPIQPNCGHTLSETIQNCQILRIGLSLRACRPRIQPTQGGEFHCGDTVPPESPAASSAVIRAISRFGVRQSLRVPRARAVAPCARTTGDPLINLVCEPSDCPWPELERHWERSHFHLAVDARLAQLSEPLDLSAAEDSGFHLQPFSQLRIRMMPVNRRKVQRAIGLIALNSLTVRTKATQCDTLSARSGCLSTVDRGGHPSEERIEIYSGANRPLRREKRVYPLGALGTNVDWLQRCC